MIDTEDQVQEARGGQLIVSAPKLEVKSVSLLFIITDLNTILSRAASVLSDQPIREQPCNYLKSTNEGVTENMQNYLKIRCELEERKQEERGSQRSIQSKTKW